MSEMTYGEYKNVPVLLIGLGGIGYFALASIISRAITANIGLYSTE